jgi:hypothetical protein
MEVVPAVTPFTFPPEVTVATPVLVLLQAPPAVASLSVVLCDVQTTMVPVILPALGTALTVTTLVADEPDFV